MSSTRYKTFLVCAPGFERALRTEIQQLKQRLPASALSTIGFSHIHLESGGVECWATREGLWALCHLSRLAEQVRVRIGSFHAIDFRGFRAGATRLPYFAYYRRDAPLIADIKAVCSKSKLIHSGAVEERVMQTLMSKYDSIVNAPDPSTFKFQDRLDRSQVENDENSSDAMPQSKKFKDKKRNHKQKEAQDVDVKSNKTRTASSSSSSPADSSSSSQSAQTMKLIVRLDHDEAQFSIDAGGGELYRRGYRTFVSEMSLRETLTAACLQVALPPALLTLTSHQSSASSSSNAKSVTAGGTQLESSDSPSTAETSSSSELPSFSSPSSPAWSMWDPFCGSGIIPIEAALMLSGASNFLNLFRSMRPSLKPPINKDDLSPLHRFSFQDWSSFDGKAYNKLLRDIESQFASRIKPGPHQISWTFYGSDRDFKSIESAQMNWTRAQKGSPTFPALFWQGDCFTPALQQRIPASMIMTHLPYGDELTEESTFRLYQQFGLLLHNRFQAGLLNWPETLLKKSFIKQRKLQELSKAAGNFEDNSLKLSPSTQVLSVTSTGPRLKRFESLDSPPSPSSTISSGSHVPVASTDHDRDPLTGLPVFVIVRNADKLQAATASSASHVQCHWRSLAAFNNRGTPVKLLQLVSIEQPTSSPLL